MFDMKKLKCFMIVAAVAMALVGCRKSVEVSLAFNEMEVASNGQSFEVGLESNGDWTIASSANWVTVTPASGSGNATLTVTALPNTSTESRTAQVTATTKNNSAVLTLTQGFADFITVNPTSIQCTEEGGDFNVEITSNMQWTVSEVPSWLSLSETSGSGNATVVVTVLALSGEFSINRTAELSFGNSQTNAKLMVMQGLTPQIAISVDPEQLQMVSEGETKTVQVVCEGEWTATASEEWVTLDKTQGVGDMQVAVTVGENPAFVARRATIAFSSSTGSMASVLLTQEASIDPHFLEVSPLSINFGSEGGEREITIGCDTEWKADVTSSWLSLSDNIGVGNANITLTAAPNALFEPRTGTIIIASDNIEREITVAQAAGSEQLFVTLSPDTLSVPYTGASRTITVASNTTWTLEGSDIVAYLLPSSGNGDATVTVVIDVNSSENPRTGYVRAMHNGQVMSEMIVVQEGKPDLLETDIMGIVAPAEGGEYTVHVTSNQGWSVVVGEIWMTVNPTSGFGNGDITVTVAPLMSMRPRTGNITIKADSGRMVVIEVKQQP